jgi:hypothetical protein
MPISLYKSNAYRSISLVLASYNSCAFSFLVLPPLLFPLLFPLFKGKRVARGAKKQKRENRACGKQR